MAGSYLHAVTKGGKLRNPETIIIATETQGDTYETIEEMYGMIWYLAKGNGALVAEAARNYLEGINTFSPGRQK
jgi:hypothetical protein